MISNASDRLITQNPGTLPDVSGAMLQWFQQMVFVLITKSVVNFQNVEVETPIDLQGVWQPLSPQQLQMKPEGQRAWKWFMLHAQPGLILKPDDVVSYLGQRFRVMSKSDYKEYGYVEYHLVQDYVP